MIGQLTILFVSHHQTETCPVDLACCWVEKSLHQCLLERIAEKIVQRTLQKSMQGCMTTHNCEVHDSLYSTQEVGSITLWMDTASVE